MRKFQMILLTSNYSWFRNELNLQLITGKWNCVHQKNIPRKSKNCPVASSSKYPQPLDTVTILMFGYNFPILWQLMELKFWSKINIKITAKINLFSQIEDESITGNFNWNNSKRAILYSDNGWHPSEWRKLLWTQSNYSLSSNSLLFVLVLWVKLIKCSKFDSFTAFGVYFNTHVDVRIKENAL